MRTSMLVTTLFSALIFGGTPSWALDCAAGQGRSVTVDFQLDEAGRPLTTREYRVISEECVDGTDKFRFNGLPVEFKTAAEMRETYEFLRAWVGKNSGNPGFRAIVLTIKFVMIKEAEAAKTP